MPEHDPSPAIKISWDTRHSPVASPGSQDALTPPVPDHTLIRRIGRGSYGEVWLARSVLGIYRAVKIVHRGAFDDQRPFEREFAGIQRFEPVSRSHESQLNVLHVGRGSDCFYYVMELADDMGRGAAVEEAAYTPRTLRSELLLRGRLPVEECLRLGLALTTALGHLHRHGLVHRDIKPSNIVFVSGIPKLADIGLVAQAEATMSFVGTEGYLPPEGPGTVQADLFSLGKVLYEISTGHDRQQFPELPTNVERLPDRAALAEFNEVLLRACAPDIKHRYQSAAEMHADLALLHSGKSVARMRAVERRLRFVARAGALVTAVAAVVAAGWLWQAKQTRVVSNLAAENLLLAQQAQGSAESARKSELAARERLYAADINHAHRALQADNLRLARSLLQNHLPQPGQPDLRGFEWRYLWEQCRSEALFSVPGHTNQAWVLALAPDGQRAAVCGKNGVTRVLDLRLRQEVAVLPSTNEVRSVSFSSGGELVATGSTNEVWVWDARSFAPRNRLPDAAAPVLFSPDGKFLLTGKTLPKVQWASPWEAEQTLALWNTTNWAVVRTSNFPPSGPYSGARDLYLQLAFGTDPGRLTVLVGDTIRVVSCPNLEELRVLPEKLHMGLIARPFIALSPDNRTLAFPSQKRYGIQLWDLDGNQRLRLLPGHADIVISAAFSPDSTLLASCSPDQTIRLWKVATGELLNTFRGQADQVFDLTFSSNGKWLVSLGGFDAMVKVWDPTRRPRQESFRALAPLGFDLNGGLLAIREVGRNPIVLDPATLEASPVVIPELREKVRYDLELNSVSADGRYVALFGRNQETNAGFVEVWDRRDAKSLCTLPAVSPRVTFAPTRKLIATFTTNGIHELTSTIWELPAGTCKWVLTNDAMYPVIAPDEKHLFTYNGGDLRLWNLGLNTMQPVLTIPSCFCYAPSPDGRLLATGEPRLDDCIQIRRLPTAEMAGELKGHTRKALRMAFSPEGRTLASICDDRTVRLWHIATQREVLQLLAPEEDKGPFNLAFSPDGRALVTSRFDGEGRITWLYYAPSFAEIAVEEGRDYKSEAKNDWLTWLAVAKALARKESWREAVEGFNEVLKLTSQREDLSWLRADTLRLRAEVLRRADGRHSRVAPSP